MLDEKCKRLFSVLILSVLIIALTSTIPILRGQDQPIGQEQPKYGGTLIVSQLFNPMTWTQNFEPAGAWWAEFTLYDPLVRYNLDLEIYPGLAYSWDISPDGLTYTFHLYQNVSWHDGVKFTSADVKFTIEYVLEQQGFGGVYFTSIEKVECPDDYTVVITLKEPDAPFLYKLGPWTGGTDILPKHLYEGTDWRTNPAHTTHPIGTGPFKFKEFVSGDHYTLEAYDDYHKGRPYLDEVVVRIIPERAVSLAALEAGEIHHMCDPPPFSAVERLDAMPHLDAVVRLAGDDTMMMYFNLMREPFDDVKVRQAILYAIDRTEVADLATFGYDKPAVGPYSNWEGIDWAFNPDATYPDYDPVKAEELLDEAGYPRGADGVRFRTTLETLTLFYEMEPTIHIIKEQLRKVGIEVDAKVLEYASFVDKVIWARDFDMAVWVIYTVPDPYTLGSIAGSMPNIGSPLYNVANYSNPRVDELLLEALVPLSREERKPYYYEVQEILSEEAPYINLIQYAWPMVWNNEFHGFYFEEGTLGTRFDWYRVWWEGAPPAAPPFPWGWVATAVVVVVVIVAAVAVWIKRRAR